MGVIVGDLEFDARIILFKLLDDLLDGWHYLRRACAGSWITAASIDCLILPWSTKL